MFFKNNITKRKTKGSLKIATKSSKNNTPKTLNFKAKNRIKRNKKKKEKSAKKKGIKMIKNMHKLNKKKKENKSKCAFLEAKKALKGRIYGDFSPYFQAKITRNMAFCKH